MSLASSASSLVLRDSIASQPDFEVRSTSALNAGYNAGTAVNLPRALPTHSLSLGSGSQANRDQAVRSSGPRPGGIACDIDDDSTLTPAPVVPGYIRLRRDLAEPLEDGEQPPPRPGDRFNFYPCAGLISYRPVRHGRPPPRQLPHIPKLTRKDKEERRKRREARVAREAREAADADRAAQVVRDEARGVGDSQFGLGLGDSQFLLSPDSAALGAATTSPTFETDGGGLEANAFPFSSEQRPRGRGQREVAPETGGFDMSGFGFEGADQHNPVSTSNPNPNPSHAQSKSISVLAPDTRPGPNPTAETHPSLRPGPLPIVPLVDLTPHSTRAYLLRLRKYNAALNPLQRVLALEAALHCVIDPTAPHHNQHHQRDKAHPHKSHHHHRQHRSDLARAKASQAILILPCQ